MIIRIGKFWLRVAAATLAGAAVLVVAFGLRLAHGPIPVTFLIHPLAQALVPADSGLDAKVQSVELVWGGWQNPLDLRARGVEVRRKGGAVALKVPEIDLQPSGWALWRGVFAPRRLEVRGGEINLIRHKDGHVDLGLDLAASASQKSNIGEFIALLVSEFSAEKPTGIARYLKRAGIAGAKLTLEDRTLGMTWKASRVNLVLSRLANEGLLGRLSVVVVLGSDQVHLAAVAQYRPSAGRADVRATVADLPVAALAPLSPRLADLAEVDVPLSGDLEFSVDRDGKPSAAQFSLRSNAGTLSWPGVAKPPVKVTDVHVAGSVAADFSRLHIAKAKLDVEGATGISAAGDLTFADAGIGIALTGGFGVIALADLPRLWPLGLASDVRKWMTENLLAGDATDGVFRVDLAPGAMADPTTIPASAVDLSFRFSNATAQYLHPLPPLTGCVGSAHLDATTFDVILDRGRVGPLSVSEGRMHLSGINIKDTQAVTEFVVRGPARAALELLDHPPLGFASKLKVPADKVDGTTAVRVRFNFPVKKHLPIADLKIIAAANLQHFTLPKILDRYRLDDGHLFLKVDNERLEVNGTAALDGVPVTLTWQREFSDKRRYESRYVLTGVFGDKARKTLFFDTVPYVQGAVDSTIVIYRSRKNSSEIEGRFGLDQAVVSLPALHWQKPAGEAASLRVLLTVPSAGPLKVDRFAFSATNFSAQGRATIDKGTLQRLDLADVRYGDNDYSATVTSLPGGGYRVAANGESFDFAPYLSDLFKPEAGAPPLDFSARLNHLVLGHGETLSNLVANGSRRDGQWRTLDVVGNFADAKLFRMAIARKADKRLLTVTSGDAGAVISGLGLSPNVVGGRLDLTATYDDSKLGSPLDGEVRLADFRIQHAPVLARILSVASLGGITALLSGQGIAFAGAVIPLHVEGAEMKIGEARAWGDAIGITASGDVGLDNATLKLRGSIIPAYTINSMVGHIPVIGDLLVGGKGGGIIGFAYSVSGPLSNPQVSVNPLSALAPGFLRQIFEGGAEPGATVALPPPGIGPGNAPPESFNP